MVKKNTIPTLDEESITLEIGISKFKFTLKKRRAIALFVSIREKVGIKDLEYPYCVGCARSSHDSHCVLANDRVIISTCLKGSEWLPKLKK